MILLISILRIKAPDIPTRSSNPPTPERIGFFHEKNSVYNGYDYVDIVEKLAEAAEVTPLISNEEDDCCGKVMYNYYYQHNCTIRLFLIYYDFLVETDSNSLMTMYGGIKDNINISDDSQKAVDLVLNIWTRFLGSLNHQLNESEYTTDVYSHGKVWKVIIQQLCNGNISLENTGVNATVWKENSRISTMEIYGWSSIKIEKSLKISIEVAKEIIDYELRNNSINMSRLNFSNYKYINGDVHYYLTYEEPIGNYTNASKSTNIVIIGVESNEIEYEMEYWNEYHFYVNVETGTLQYETHISSRIIDEH